MCVNCGDPECHEMDPDAPIGAFGVAHRDGENRMAFYVDTNREMTFLVAGVSSIWGGILQGSIEEGDADPKYLPSASLTLVGPSPFTNGVVNLIFTQEGLTAMLKSVLLGILPQDYAEKALKVTRMLYNQAKEREGNDRYPANFKEFAELWEKISPEGEIQVSYPKPGASYSRAVHAYEVGDTPTIETINQLRELEEIFQAPAAGEEEDPDA